jgi:uncharacterized protein
MTTPAQRIRVKLFLLFFSIVLISFYAYLGLGLIGPLALPRSTATFSWAGLALPFALILWLPLHYWKLDEPTDEQNPMLWAAFGSMSLLSFLFFFLTVRHFSVLALTIYASLSAQESTFVLRALEVLRGTRATEAILVLTAASLALGFWGAHRTPSVVDVEIPIEGLPKSLVGLRIVQISDLHISATIRRPFVEQVVETVNALKPDLVALTGDLVDGTVSQLAPHFEPLKALKAPLGRFYVTGNHEHYWEPLAWIEHVRACGFTALVNSHTVLEHGGSKIVVAGVLDYWAKHDNYWAESSNGEMSSDPVAAISNTPSDTALKILLAHQPKSALAAAPLGYDLQLSGHTHGGQFFPWTVAIKALQPYVAGLYRVGKMWLYVNRGTGYWGPPMRLGSASEITILRLKLAP